MKFMFNGSKGIEVVDDVMGLSLPLGNIVMGPDGVYVFFAHSICASFTGRYLSQIVDKLSELNRSWMEAESAPSRISYL